MHRPTGSSWIRRLVIDSRCARGRTRLHRTLASCLVLGRSTGLPTVRLPCPAGRFAEVSLGSRTGVRGVVRRVLSGPEPGPQGVCRKSCRKWSSSCVVLLW